MSVVSLEPEIEKKHIEAARRNKSDFAPLYEHYKTPIQNFFSYRLTDPIAAEELTSTVFEKALKGIDNFQWQGVSFSAWLFRIARNTLIDHYREQGKSSEKVSQLDHSIDIPSKEKSIPDQIETKFAEELLYEILSELPTREQEIIYMKFFDGYTNRLIAQLTGISETNVGTIVYRAIKKLRGIYRDRGQTDILN